MKFVLVNGRTPRPQSFCALCCEAIKESYLRELKTRLSYCDHKCYAGHCKLPDRKSTRLNSVTSASRMPSSA